MDKSLKRYFHNVKEKRIFEVPLDTTSSPFKTLNNNSVYGANNVEITKNEYEKLKELYEQQGGN